MSFNKKKVFEHISEVIPSVIVVQVSKVFLKNSQTKISTKFLQKLLKEFSKEFSQE